MSRLEIAVAIAFGIAMETCDDPQRMSTAASASPPSAPGAEAVPPPPEPAPKHLEEERVNVCAEVRRIAKGTSFRMEDCMELRRTVHACGAAPDAAAVSDLVARLSEGTTFFDITTQPAGPARDKKQARACIDAKVRR